MISDDFALYTMQIRWSHNADIVNGGTFNTSWLTFVGGSNPTGTELYQKAGWFSNAHFTRLNTTQIGWATINAPLESEEVTVIDGAWKKVARFSVKLRNASNTAFHNFADLDPQFAFELSGTNTTVRRCNWEGTNPGATMVGTTNVVVPRATNGLTPALGVAVNSNELAGYYMSANTDWGTATSWNNAVAAAHPAFNKLPGVTNNALVGVASVISTSTRASIKNLYFKVGGSLTIKSDATGTGYLIHNNSGVAATVERYLSQTFYHYVSSPISNATNSLFQGTLGVDDFWQWNEVLNQWENLNAPGVPSSDPLTIAKGYAVAYNLAKTLQFTGTLNTGDIPFAVTYTTNWLQKGFNFTGNPYPSPINANTFITDNTSFFDETGGGLYFWDEAAGYNGVRWDYATYTLTGGTPGGSIGGQNSFEPNGIIAPSQGFMVNVNHAGNLQFKNTMRTTADAYFFKDDEIIARSWLAVTGPEGDYNEILTGFLAEGQEGIDITDAVKLKGNTKLAFYTLLDGKDYVIQGLPTFDPFTGAYTFKMREIENFDSQVMFTLEDKLNGTFFDLRGNTEYVAQIVDAGEIRDRFVMHINGVTAVPEVAKQLTKVYATNNQIVIELVGNNKILDVEVLNTLGQTITKTQVNATNATLNINGSNVVYIVRVRTNQGVESHKILLH